MTLRLLIAFLAFVLCQAAFAFEERDSANAAVPTPESSNEKSVTGFKRAYPLRILCDYNFVSLATGDASAKYLTSNRPVEVGIGFGYKDLYFDLRYALPFTVSNGRSKSAAYETGLDFFPGNWWLSGKYRRYAGFTSGDDSSNVFVNLFERDLYISALWIGTSDGKFSPRAAFFLDRKQRYSAGSLIVGGRLQHTKTKDKGSTLKDFQEYRKIHSQWVNAGYTYTWVFNNKMFLNAWGTAGVSLNEEYKTKKIFVIPEVGMKMAYGYIGEKWSWNNVLEFGYTPNFTDVLWEQEIVAAFKILVVRRF